MIRALGMKQLGKSGPAMVGAGDNTKEALSWGPQEPAPRRQGGCPGVNDAQGKTVSSLVF